MDFVGKCILCGQEGVTLARGGGTVGKLLGECTACFNPTPEGQEVQGGGWQHVAISRDREKRHLYVNGQLLRTSEDGRFAVGEMWLTGDEIRALYEMTRGGY